METGNSILGTLGTATPVTGFLTINHIHRLNILGSYSWGDYMDKLRAFQWPLFAGFVILLIWIMFKTDKTDHHDHHDDSNGGNRRLAPVRVRSQYKSPF